LKLIDSEKASTSYYPIDFSEKGKIKFTKSNVSLGDEYVIAFEKTTN
jgi:hypothetical protein